MRSFVSALVLATCCCLASATAHGPQIQTTNEGGKIVTREIVDDSSYHSSLTDPKQVYAMPLVKTAGVWRAGPDPNFTGWPGFAYGFGYDAVTNPEPFPVGSKFVLGFTEGLQKWNGTNFEDAGLTEAEAYRGTSVNPSALAKTSDTAPFASLMFPTSGITYPINDPADVHNTVHYRMLGDGNSDTSTLPDGIYKLGLQLSSTDSAIEASEPFYFLLTKNAKGELPAAIASLGIDSSLVQVIVPEPHSLSLLGVFLGAVFTIRTRKRLNR